jgi:hypothetical protein
MSVGSTLQLQAREINSIHFKRGKQESAPKNLLDGLKGGLFGGIRRNQIGKICVFE